MTPPSIKSRFKSVLDEVLGYAPNADADLLRRAYDQTMLWHGQKKSKLGDAFLVHPVEVAAQVVRLHMDDKSVAAALLHDAQVENLATNEEIEQQFGKEVAFLVNEVTMLSRLNFRSRQAEQAKSFRKMFLAMASEIRVIFIKLADRLQVMRDLQLIADADRRQQLAQETLDIYAPIASRLGIHWLKSELENLSLGVLHPEEYTEITEYVARYQQEQRTHVDNVVRQMKDVLSEHNIEAKVYGRTKHYYSIYRKIRRKLIGMDQLYDLVAFRIIVQNLEQCYQTLGLVHTLWRPIQGMFEDYIAMPKPNGYQSLHTIVVGPYGDRMEIQIRTRHMHDIAENGVAAHWSYKEQGHSGYDPKEHSQINWLRQLTSSYSEADDPNEFIDLLRLDLFSDYVFVFTPDGDVRELPIESTPLDFAFSIHSEVGMHCTGAKVNGKIVPLKYQLRNGDEVSIMTSKNQHPNKEWLDFVKTSRAKNKIRHALREEEREKSRELGRELVEREFKKHGLNFNRLQKDGELDESLKNMRYRNIDEALIAIGRGKARISELLGKHAPEQEKEEDKAKLYEEPPAPPVHRNKRSKSGICISDIDNMMVRFAKCCSPIPGDAIVGFVTRGHGVTIHRADCRMLPKAEPERVLEAYWDEKQQLELPVALKVIGKDQPGLLTHVSAIFSDFRINILSVWASSDAGRGTSIFKFHIKSEEQLDKLKRAIRRQKGILSVERVIDYRTD